MADLPENLAWLVKVGQITQQEAEQMVTKPTPAPITQKESE